LVSPSQRGPLLRSSRGPAALGPRGARSTRWGLLYRPLPKGKRGSPCTPCRRGLSVLLVQGESAVYHTAKGKAPRETRGASLGLSVFLPWRVLGQVICSCIHAPILTQSVFLLRTATRQGGVCCPCGGLYPRFSASGRPWLSPCGRDTPPWRGPRAPRFPVPGSATPPGGLPHVGKAPSSLSWGFRPKPSNSSPSGHFLTLRGPTPACFGGGRPAP
jgi:hypothetical protein